MSLKVQSEILLKNSKHQKQKSKKKMTFVIFCLNIFEEKALTLFISNPLYFSFLVHFK
jgi:hypothetical protein